MIDEVLEDVDISHFDNIRESSYRILIKFDVSVVPEGKVTDAKLFLYRGGGNGWSGNVSVYGIDNQSWREDYDIDSLWKMNTQRTNMQQFNGKWASNGWDWVDVTTTVTGNYDSGNENVSLWLEDPNFNATVPNNVGNHLLMSSYLYLGRASDINNYTALRSSENGKAGTTPYLNITVDEIPFYSNISTGLVDIFTGFVYSNFSIAWEDDSANLSVYLENNFSGSLENDTMSGNYYYNSTTLAAGTYHFRFVAVDSAGNMNATDTQYFTIERGIPEVSISMSPSSTVTDPTQTAVVGIENNLGDDDVVYNLWRGSLLITNGSPYQDVSILGAGSYFYVFNTSGGQNWTGNNINSTLTVEQALPVTGGTITGGGALYIPPPEKEEEGCAEDWNCEEWTDCIDGSQKRTCTDGNNCGTEERKPLESRECSVPEEAIEEKEEAIEKEAAPTGLFLGFETGSILLIMLAVSAIVFVALIILGRKMKRERKILEKPEIYYGEFISRRSRTSPASWAFP